MLLISISSYSWVCLNAKIQDRHFENISCDHVPFKLSFGSNGISSYISKSCVYILINPIPRLFNFSLSLKIVPNFWKNYYLIPVFKSGDIYKVESYRVVGSHSKTSN